MLLSFSIQNFAIVENVDLEFSGGFTVLTGETGAGKSILIEALAAVLGERAEASSVRSGARKAEIHAEFSIANQDGLVMWLKENDLEGDGDVCLLRRVIESSGKSRAYVNGIQVTLQQLREVGDWLVDIHGQHAHQSLLKSGKQRELLDNLAGVSALAREVADVYRQWVSAKKDRLSFEENRAQIEEERESLRYSINELGKLDFDAEKWAELLQDDRRLKHSEGLLEGVKYALDSLSESEDDLLSRISAIQSKLESILEYDAELKEALSLIEPAQIQLQEAVYMLRHYRDKVDLDPEKLREVEARIDAVHSISRKYRVQAEELPFVLQRMKERLAQLEESGSLDAILEKETRARDQYLALAGSLSQAREDTARKLSAEVTDALQQLSMIGGKFVVALSPLPEGNAHGLEDIEFLVSSHSAGEPRPLLKVASGGELSRISLAIQVFASRASNVPTLIFDEVDVGIGGAVAEIVGRLLRKLGESRQVLCVTHLPQVASRANCQWSVSKDGAKSEVRLLDEKSRIDEIARMLGGLEITEKTLEHAAEMLRL